MENERQIEFVSELLVATGRGDLSWKSAFKNSFFVSFPENSIEIGRARDDFYLALSDGGGQEIYRWSEYNMNTDAYSKLTELYDVARRKALGVDAAVDSIISRLRRAG
ncbi:hypothetical protein HL658_27620 [Azospirillum sp. RWY-5-1]|uniref:Uncharacterized protein n=1 Tax=Azospirillum oleiclasticum TaxID=2735135 RepID=A0ABX2TJ85_9PROT|nr:hypothetical protein [Azospirillum oleiclasticum]NYZ16328.1 hypothetical protein [Azospirillum oleiclasticum]NYZ23815.1 hypothetical protein [Azospirillum oleiclasticum]